MTREYVGLSKTKEHQMFIKSLLSKIEAWRHYRASVRELQVLTDRELNDLGIARSDIEFVARQAVAA